MTDNGKPKVLVTGRGFEVTDAIRAFVTDRLKKLGRYVDDIIEIHAFLTVEKYRHEAEVNVHTRRSDLGSTMVSSDMYTSLTGVFNKLETQAKKLKEKRKERKRMDSGKRETVVEPLREAGAKGRVIRVNNFNLKPMSIEDAALKMTADKGEFLVFRSTVSDQIAVVYKRKDGNIGLIEPEL